MKQLTFVMLTAFVFISNAESQLEMNSSGNIGIGTTPSSTYKLYLSGNTYLRQGNAKLYLKDNKTKLGHAYTMDYIYIDADYSEEEIRFYPSDDDVGYVGTSSKPFYKMYSRYIYQDGSLVTSDVRSKENIVDLSGSLEKVMSIRGIKYDLISPDKPDWTESKKNEIEYLDKNRIGFIAQELLEVYPELVKYDEKSDKYSVDYLGVIPVIVEAIKEQQQEIEELKTSIELLGSSAELKGSSSITTSISDFDRGLDNTRLFQNSPNPFTDKTSIEYYLADAVISATIFIYDMSGKQLRSYDLHHERGGELTINGGELDAGMYMYTMIADGVLVGTKQMLLTD